MLAGSSLSDRGDIVYLTATERCQLSSRVVVVATIFRASIVLVLRGDGLFQAAEWTSARRLMGRAIRPQGLRDFSLPAEPITASRGETFLEPHPAVDALIIARGAGRSLAQLLSSVWEMVVESR